MQNKLVKDCTIEELEEVLKQRRQIQEAYDLVNQLNDILQKLEKMDCQVEDLVSGMYTIKAFDCSVIGDKVVVEYEEVERKQ